jgi:hypothetical protein
MTDPEGGGPSTDAVAQTLESLTGAHPPFAPLVQDWGIGGAQGLAGSVCAGMTLTAP